MHTCMYTYLFMHSYVHKYIYSYIHTNDHTCIGMFGADNSSKRNRNDDNKMRDGGL